MRIGVVAPGRDPQQLAWGVAEGPPGPFRPAIVFSAFFLSALEDA
jgi:hypothetical protein